MAQHAPRVAVVGGGIAGTLCSLVLRHKGIQPTIIDAGRSVGGRLRNGGAQFLRAADPRFAGLVEMLEQKGLLREWKGRFGMLGSAGGGFLPAEIITKNTAYSQRTVGSNPQDGMSGEEEAQEKSMIAATDGGDFCRFVDGSTVPTYVGVPSMTEFCPEICRLAQIPQILDSKLVSATPIKEGGWTLDVETNGGNAGFSNEKDATFDALVLAIHDPSVASGVIRSILDAENLAAGGSNDASNDEKTLPLVLNRLKELADSLQKVRDNEKLPVYSVGITYPAGFSKEIPFDAVSVPASQVVQFLSSESSKSGFSESLDNSDEGEMWTAISTSRIASTILSQPDLSHETMAEHIVTGVVTEVGELLAQYHGGTTPEPLEVIVKRWSAAFCSRGLNLKEDSILLSPWRLAICGDYIRDQSEYTTPLEAAALSGLEAGERTASFWTPEEMPCWANSTVSAWFFGLEDV